MDERLRALQRAGGDRSERLALARELRRAGGAEVQAAEAALANLREKLDVLRGLVDADRGTRPDPRPCPELSAASLLDTLELALQPLEGASDTGYGTCELARWVEGRGTASMSLVVLALAFSDQEQVLVGATFQVAKRPSLGVAFGELTSWRESLKPETKRRKLRAWAASRHRAQEVRVRLSRAEARLVVDLLRLEQVEVSGEDAPPPRRSKPAKVTWEGRVVGVQPRLKRALVYDSGEHEFFPQGWALWIEGFVDEEQRAFRVGLGPAAATKHDPQLEDRFRGEAWPVDDPALVPIDFYRVSKVKKVAAGGPPTLEPPPHTKRPALEDYRELPARWLPEGLLDRDPCRACVWGCRVQLEEDPHQPPLRAACFGPIDCPTFPTRSLV